MHELVGLPEKKLTFSIRADHPAAEKLTRLVKMLATSSRLPSGLTVQHSGENPEAVRLVLRELRDALVMDGADVSALDKLIKAPSMASADEIFKGIFSSPGAFGHLMSEAKNAGRRDRRRP